MENTNCIICNKINNELFSTFIIDKNKYTLVRCIDCNFVYLNPRIEEKNISQFYNDDYQPFQKKISFLNIIYKIARKINFYFKYKIISKYNSKGKILDIGSGDNFFSNSIKSKGWQSFTYDKFYNSSTNIKDLSILKNKNFDCITLWHSIEHMYDIDSIFKNINKLLSKDGYLYIACPNLEASEVNFLKNDWIAFDIPRHLYHFNFNSMKKFLNIYNFKIVEIKSLKFDCLFNVFMSKNINILKKIFIFFNSLIIQSFNVKKSSTIIYICKLK